jgi:uncharacterized membrane protein
MADDLCSGSVVKMIAAKVIRLISDEVNKEETQRLVREKVIIPVINMIYAELYPYIIALIVTIITIFILTLLTFISFLIYYFGVPHKGAAAILHL